MILTPEKKAELEERLQGLRELASALSRASHTPAVCQEGTLLHRHLRGFLRMVEDDLIDPVVAELNGRRAPEDHGVCALSPRLRTSKPTEFPTLPQDMELGPELVDGECGGIQNYANRHGRICPRWDSDSRGCYGSIDTGRCPRLGR